MPFTHKGSWRSTVYTRKFAWIRLFYTEKVIVWNISNEPFRILFIYISILLLTTLGSLIYSNTCLQILLLNSDLISNSWYRAWSSLILVVKFKLFLKLFSPKTGQRVIWKLWYEKRFILQCLHRVLIGIFDKLHFILAKSLSYHLILSWHALLYNVVEFRMHNRFDYVWFKSSFIMLKFSIFN